MESESEPGLGLESELELEERDREQSYCGGLTKAGEGGIMNINTINCEQNATLVPLIVNGV